jgi:hypothetical protein
MQTRQLGKTGMQITRIGLGTWAIGGGQWEFAWGPQDDRESIDYDPSCTGSGHQLDRYRRCVWTGPLRRDRWSGH